MRSQKVAIAVMVAAAFITGCGSGEASPSEHSSTTAAPDRTSFKDIAGEFPQPATLTDSGATDAPVTGCVNVAGTPARAVLDLADCTTPQATYRVIQRVTTPDQCIADTDRPFYYRDTTIERTACLDLNWDPVYCINLATVITKVACDDPNAPTKSSRPD